MAAGRHELRIDEAAGVVADRAARVEAAAGRDVDRVGRLALQDLRAGADRSDRGAERPR